MCAIGQARAALSSARLGGGRPGERGPKPPCDSAEAAAATQRPGRRRQRPRQAGTAAPRGGQGTREGWWASGTSQRPEGGARDREKRLGVRPGEADERPCAGEGRPRGGGEGPRPGLAWPGGRLGPSITRSWSLGAAEGRITRLEERGLRRPGAFGPSPSRAVES